MNEDVKLQRAVLEELDWEPALDASQVGVAVHRGVVTLTGHLPVYAQKHAAEEAAKRVLGVRGIANEIEVRPGEEHERDDEDLADAAVSALHWDALTPSEHVQVSVSNGWLTLSGAVESRHHQLAAERAVRQLAGVRGVTNEIAVRPLAPAPPEEAVCCERVKNGIEAALARSALLRARRLGVDLDGACVVLEGDVHSLAEREEAERIAWAGRGVGRVVNCLTITPWGSGPAEEWGY